VDWFKLGRPPLCIYSLLGDVHSVVPVSVKWYNIVTGGLCIGLSILELFELIISVLLTFCRASGGCRRHGLYC
jgi:hypothetical protein